MVTTMQPQKQSNSNKDQMQEGLLIYGKEGVLVYDGGIPNLKGDLLVELAHLFLEEIGRVNFLKKIKARDWNDQDVERVSFFLMKHGVQPTADNNFALVMSARLDLIFSS